MSPAQNTVKSLAEQRARKQKIFIAVGSVVLLAVLGYQLPKIMGHKGGQSAAPAASTGSLPLSRPARGTTITAVSSAGKPVTRTSAM